MSASKDEFCKSCDSCSGGIPTKVEMAIKKVTGGVKTVVDALRPHCPRCGHNMSYHRGNIAYWRKKEK